MLSAAALKARLDRVFLEIVSPKADTGDNSDADADADAIAELEQDLESLYSDIPSVAQMAVEQEYLRPVRKEVENGRKKANESLRVGGAYVSAQSPISILDSNTSLNFRFAMYCCIYKNGIYQQLRDLIGSSPKRAQYPK